MKKVFRILVPALLAALVVVSIGWYLFVYDRGFTRDMLLQQARYNDLRGNNRVSAWFYNLAYRHSGQDENVAIELANQYKADGNYTKAEVTLSNAINNVATPELYTALSKTFVEQDKLLDAISLLNNISDPEIKAALEEQRPSAPAADHDSGYYSQYISVALSSSTGTIYYTTDGDYPSIADIPYAKPLDLHLGETQIYCVSVSDTGLVSPMTILGYTVGGVIEPAIFMDNAMELAIREAIGCEEDHVLYTNDLWNLTEFTVPAEVTTLEDLSHMNFLESLTISPRNLDSLGDFSGLTKLNKLDLTGCKFPASELHVLASLPELDELILSNCGLSTIAELDNAVNLEYLDLSNNTIRNLEPLAKMAHLQELYLQHNALTDLKDIGSLPSLTKLDVSYNALTTLSPISGCIKLSYLNAANNQLTTAEGTTSLPLLTHLYLDYNSLQDVESIAGCVGLTNLSISNNGLNDISSLSILSKLEVFDFSYNHVEALPAWPKETPLRVIDGSYNALTSIDSLADLSEISYIYMDYNLITNVDALAPCFNLVQVNVYGNEIESVSELTAHDIIVNYDPTKK